MIYLTAWRTRDGKRRYVRLYRAWKGLKARSSGTTFSGNGHSYWAGKAVEFISWEHFRRWSLANGYSRTCSSLDRIKSHLGYGPNNCQWLSRGDNSSRTIEAHTFGCNCNFCRDRHHQRLRDARDHEATFVGVD